jgi:hypothetical protein
MALMHDELLAALPADVYQALDVAPGMPYKPSVKLQEQAPARLCCPERRGHLRVRRQPARLDSDVTGELAIFAVDFAPYSTRSWASPCSPPYGREGVIHEKLQAVGLALRA